MRISARSTTFLATSVLAFGVVTTGCSESPGRLDGSTRDARGGDSGAVDASAVIDASTGLDAALLSEGGVRCGDSGVCGAGTICLNGACVPEGAPCTMTSECTGDSRCVNGRCRPFGPGETDSTCVRDVRPGVFAPSIQCSFDTAPTEDAFPEHTHVYGAVVVGDLAINGRGPDSEPHPSIVAIFETTAVLNPIPQTGIIRILDGETCALQATLSTELVTGSTSPAIADLDNDGTGEIVAHKAGGGLVAYKYRNGSWQVFWTSTNMGAPFPAQGGWWSGPSIVDVDNDGLPEVIRVGLVFNGQTGALIGGMSGAAGIATYDSRGAFGTHPVVLDVDEDGIVELIDGSRVYQWDNAMRDWVAETYSTVLGNVGHVAVADFGAFPSTRFTDPALPEVAVVSNGTVRIQTLEGTVVFGPITLPGGGMGGTPTVADFDGDGLAEVASAGASEYAVFDPDCTATPRATGRCGSMTTTGVLWSRPSQDGSSAVTGSTSFDFEGDGRVEAVYADECFLRVYDGASGDVLYSTAHSSCTWYEFPIVADADGDSRAEIIMGSNHLCGTPGVGRACPGVDAMNTDRIFPGLRCQAASDCGSGSCVEGFCRCTASTECCASGDTTCGFVCVAPPAGTPGTGNTCRAARNVGPHGVRVFRDVQDRWVGSRTVWNQHAYNVTNINPDLRVPQTSMVVHNWRTPGLNHFRTNVQGEAASMGAPDGTVQYGDYECTSDNIARPNAQVCNRGGAPLSNDATVGFYLGDPAAGGTRVCSAPIGATLQPGQCTMVECEWRTVGMVPMTLRARIDDGESIRECRENNNDVVIAGVACPRLS